MRSAPETPGELKGQFGSYGEAFKIYEDGKHRRYNLLFAVNGGGFAILKFGHESGLGPIVRVIAV